jgi:hypothetical protein
MSFPQSATIELEIKKAPAKKLGLSPLITRNLNQETNLAVTRLL